MNAPYGFAANPKDFIGRNTQRFVPNVGLIQEPNSETRYTNHMDFWTITRISSLGFMDREPISPERAAESCHITLIGDSTVQAREVAISDKAQVKLEELAARELPQLNVTASAFGRKGTGQINQLAFYDEYARFLSPKVVALVFVSNDFWENSAVISSLMRWGIDPEHLPVVSAGRDANGNPELRPPDPDYDAFRLPPPPSQAQSLDSNNSDVISHIASFVNYSYFAKWMDIKIDTMLNNIAPPIPELIIWRAELLSRQPRYSTLLQGWSPTEYNPITSIFEESDLPPVFEDALTYTKFGIEQFKRRAERDDAKLVILSAHTTKRYGNLSFQRLTAMVEDLEIPVIDQHEYIIGIGADPMDAEFKHDAHWNEDGHRWAAEALLEWLRDNQEVCD